MLASSSLLVLSLSLPIMLTLPTLLLNVLFSCCRPGCCPPLPSCPHGKLLGPRAFGESSAMLPIDIFRAGIFSARCVITGEEPGELWSMTVEWCRVVQARLKSRPLECLGRLVAGECWSEDERFGLFWCMKMLSDTSFGLSGAAKGAEIPLRSPSEVEAEDARPSPVEDDLGGSFNVRPRVRNSGRRGTGRGVDGDSCNAWSSRLPRFS